MRTLGILLAWSVPVGVILYAALSPDGGVVFHSPMTALGIGMIGLGMCLEARRRLLAASVPARTPR